jgi:hypothetical protein
MWRYGLSVYIRKGKLKLVYVEVSVMKHIVCEGGFATGGATTIHLKVIRISKEPSPVQDHQVPIFIEDQHMFRSEQWDLTTYQVMLRGSGRLSAF